MSLSVMPEPLYPEAAHAQRDSRTDLEVDALLALQNAYELTGDDATLVDELVEGVLPVGAGFAKVNLT